MKTYLLKFNIRFLYSTLNQIVLPIKQNKNKILLFQKISIQLFATDTLLSNFVTTPIY